MNSTTGIGIPIILIAAVAAIGVAVVFLLGMFCYKRALGISRGQAALVLLLCLGLSAASVFYRASDEFPRGPVGGPPAWVLIAAGLLPFFAVPFLIRLYQRWIGNRLSEAEKNQGMDGIRAWLSGGNLICAIAIATLAYFGYSYSFWGVLALAIMALLAYPILNMVSATAQPTPPAKVEDLSPDRDRVLRMLDEGKISADESAELLNALGHTVRPPPLPASTTADPNRKMVLVGLALLLIGFFLPWFSFNLGDEMNRVFSGLQQQMTELSKQNPGIPFQMPSTGFVHITGSEIHYGLGWFVLLLGIAAAALPYIANHLPSATLRKARLVILGAGSLILIYLFTDNVRFVSIGLMLGLAGYALQWVGMLKERQAISK